jgi:hypothetical protein
MNNNKHVGLVIHFNEELQQEQISKLEASLGNDEGVKQARVNEKRSHLMLVDYLPGVITARHVIDYIKNKGYTAVVVGWV